MLSVFPEFAQTFDEDQRGKALLNLSEDLRTILRRLAPSHRVWRIRLLAHIFALLPSPRYLCRGSLSCGRLPQPFFRGRKRYRGATWMNGLWRKRITERIKPLP